MKRTPTSRRRFLRDASIMTVATAGFANLPVRCQAETTSAVDRVQTVELGVKPDMTSSGAVVVQKSRLTFLTFLATQIDEQGAYQGSGTAVIELEGCVARKTRYGGGEELLDHSIFIDNLAICETFEVIDSSWAATWQGAVGNPGAPLRHLIVTFFGLNPHGNRAPHFECLAQDLNVTFFADASFDEILDYAEYRDAGTSDYADEPDSVAAAMSEEEMEIESQMQAEMESQMEAEMQAQMESEMQFGYE